MAGFEELLSPVDLPVDEAPAAAAADVDQGFQGKQADKLVCFCLLAACSLSRIMVQASAVTWYTSTDC